VYRITKTATIKSPSAASLFLIKLPTLLKNIHPQRRAIIEAADEYKYINMPKTATLRMIN
jgi:hypothetical protein